MKAIFQIAAGIVLAALVLAGIRYGYISYEMNQLEKHFKSSIEKMNQASQQNKSALIEKQKAEAIQKNEFERLRKELQRKKDVEDVRREVAWLEFYQIPDNCEHPSQQDKDWCWKQFVRKKGEFNQLWDKGRIEFN